MELYINPNIPKSTNSQNKRSATASRVKLRVVRNENPPVSSVENQPMDTGEFSVWFRQETTMPDDVLNQCRIQPLVVRNYLDLTKVRVINHPENTLHAQANISAEAVNRLLA